MSKQQEAKTQLGYRKSPMQCSTCNAFRAYWEGSSVRKRCTFGGFAVQSTGSCKEWKEETVNSPADPSSVPVAEE
jgi:hypothetical protein